ncbi:MAG: hypothetical protein IKE60_27585 [Reyranella sp.]|jgi:hypothetical protein|uniref:hypothetical protein n=1 Tax=Reyranella sp. TaxID=1929291 RepID=UPI0009698122|nr:hypothetical protein [Reyranella sp.]MBN9540830.1 hypothetical protein [Alphaproteobacteria bacterium]MBR2818458.1 hypothetical protein [Reyranella sp.]OJU45538.1 MAG: hypothetical protein BGN99_29295 [Alphaproteobacteria bacterium 65-37]
MMHRTLLALALIASAGAVHAQTTTPVDPYGRPLLGREDWVRQPGDQPGPASGMTGGSSSVSTPMTAAPMTYAPTTYAPPAGGPTYNDMAAAPAMSADSSRVGSGPHPVAFRDEFGFRYDAQGNRLDARGYVMAAPYSGTYR